MKKFLKSKGFKVTALSACCVGVLAACFFFGRDKDEEFIPDAQLSEDTVSEWEEPARTPSKEEATGETDGNTIGYHTAREATTQEPYPKVAEETEEETVVDFTPLVEESKTDTPEKPETQADTTNPAVTPSYQPEELEVNESEGQEAVEPSPAGKDGNTNKTPAAGDRNEKGEYYIPGFGWSLPSPVEQIVMDNDGDPNKQVGNM